MHPWATLLGSLVFNKGFAIWKWPHLHPRSLQVSGTCISLVPRFQETFHGFPEWAPDKLFFESHVLTYFNWWRLKHQPKRLERNINKKKNSQCQTIISLAFLHLPSKCLSQKDSILKDWMLFFLLKAAAAFCWCESLPIIATTSANMWPTDSKSKPAWRERKKIHFERFTLEYWKVILVFYNYATLLAKNTRHNQKLSQPIVTCLQMFSRAPRKLHMFASRFDWFTGLSVSFVIGYSNYLGFGFITLDWKALYGKLIAI